MKKLRSRNFIIAPVMAATGVLTVSFGIAGTSVAQTLPADCSVGAIVEGPLVLRMPGAADLPLMTAKVTSLGKMTITADDGKETSYNEMELEIRDRTPSRVFERVSEVTTAFLVGEDQVLDNRVFRNPATARDAPETSARDKADNPLMFQGWGVKIPAPAESNDEYTVDLSHVGSIASVRVEFGKRSGNSIPGKIHMCVPGNQTGLFHDAPSKPIEVVGSFIATVE